MPAYILTHYAKLVPDNRPLFRRSGAVQQILHCSPRVHKFAPYTCTWTSIVWQGPGNMAWRPQFHPAPPSVCYENDRMPVNRPVTPGSYIPGPFPPPLSLHTNIPGDSRVRAQWTELPPEQQFQTRGMVQQLPPHGLQPQPPTRAWYGPPPSPNINANWSHTNRADQSQSFTVGPRPPHPHQHVWSPSVPQPLLEPYHMSPQWQPTCKTGNMVPADLSPLLPPRPHPLMGDGPPSVTQHSGPLVNPFIADWLRIVGSSRTQRSHQQSSTKVQYSLGVVCLSSSPRLFSPPVFVWTRPTI